MKNTKDISSVTTTDAGRRAFLKTGSMVLQMQKKVIALAIAAAFAAPIAMAETANVNVYGSIDAGLRNTSGANINGVKQDVSTNFSSGVFNYNRFGLKGTEDLGDDMKAGFGLEGNFNTGTGVGASALFDRNATVFIESGSNKLEMGRQNSVAFKTIGTYDPFGLKFFGITYAGAASVNVRLDNNYSYTGKFGAVTVMAEHAKDNATATAVGTTGAVSSAGATYASGDLNMGAVYSTTSTPSKVTTAASNASTKYYTLGAGYKFDDIKVTVGYALNTKSTLTDPVATTDATSKFTWLGASYAVSNKIGVTAAVYRAAVTPGALVSAATPLEQKSTLLIVGAIYALSKRTTAYVEIDSSQFDNGDSLAVGGRTNKAAGSSIGLATTF